MFHVLVPGNQTGYRTSRTALWLVYGLMLLSTSYRAACKFQDTVTSTSYQEQARPELHYFQASEERLSSCLFDCLCA